MIKAAIDLRPLTVFIGPSNTGKSYLAILIYVVHSLFSGDEFAPFRRRPMRRILNHLAPSDIRKRRNLSEDDIEQLVDWTADVAFARESDGFPTPFRGPLPDHVAALVRPALRDVDASGPAEAPLRLGDDLTFDRGANFFLRRMREDPDDDVKRQSIASGWIRNLADSVVSHSVGPLSRPAFYLPAERAGVMHAHRVVVGALVEQAASAGLRRAPQVPTLSGVLADFLEELIELDDTARRRDGHDDGFAGFLERDMPKGSVQNGLSDTRYPSFSYRPDGWPDGWKKNLPLMNTSSMVSELAPVVLYLRHLVGRGDTLIIEEPESHLHPAMQAAFCAAPGRHGSCRHSGHRHHAQRVAAGSVRQRGADVRARRKAEEGISGR